MPDSSWLWYIQVASLKKKQADARKEYVDLLMQSDEEVILLRQELLALRGALTDAEAESEKVKLALEREVSVYIIYFFAPKFALLTHSQHVC